MWPAVYLDPFRARTALRVCGLLFSWGVKKSFIKDKSLKVHVGVHSNITWMVLDFIMIHAGSNRSAISVAGDNML